MSEKYRPSPDKVSQKPVHMPDSWFSAFVDTNKRFTFLEEPLKIKVGNAVVQSMARGEMTTDQVRATTFSPSQVEATVSTVKKIHDQLGIPVPPVEKYSAFWEMKKQDMMGFIAGVQKEGHNLHDLSQLYDAANASLGSDESKALGRNNRQRLETEIAAKMKRTKLPEGHHQAKMADLHSLQEIISNKVNIRAEEKDINPQLTDKFLNHIFS